MFSSTHQFQRDDSVKTGSGASFRDYVPTTPETKWISTWADFRAARGMLGFNEDQTEICLHLPVGYKFSIQFARADATGDTRSDTIPEGESLAASLTMLRRLIGTESPEGRRQMRDIVARVERDTSDMLAGLQWLLDDMNDARETHDENGDVFDSVEDAAAALIHAGGNLNWYSAEDAERYRMKCKAEA